MYNLPRTINFFLVAFRLLPVVTEHFCSCVCVCQEHLRSRSGDVYLDTCMTHRPSIKGTKLLFIVITAIIIIIRHTRSIFVLPHTDCFLFWLIFIVLAWECVTGRWRGFRRCIFEYVSQSILFGPHTDSCLFWLTVTIFFLACVCVTGWIAKSDDMVPHQ